jgi:ribosomal-protein-alanine N-acetyltransferase
MNPLAATVKVRPLTLADLDRVIEIEQNITGAPHWPPSAYLAALGSQAAPLRIALAVEAPSDGSSSPDRRGLAGFAVASLLPPQAELETIAVAAEFQRRGLAGRLFASLAAELRAAHVIEVFLEVRASNQPALGFYRQVGFVDTGRRRSYYHDPVEDAVLMRLQL